MYPATPRYFQNHPKNDKTPLTEQGTGVLSLARDNSTVVQAIFSPFRKVPVLREGKGGTKGDLRSVSRRVEDKRACNERSE